MSEPLPAAFEGDTLVAAKGLGVRGDGRWLVHDIDLDVRRGEIVTVIGPNGGGKTTLARALLGLVPAAAGRIERAAGLRIGYVPQRLQIDRTLPLSVGRLMTATHRASADEVTAALAETGVAALCDRPVQALSGGEFQRVMLARALLRRPDLLVLDEPVQGVDFGGEAMLYQLIADLRDRRHLGILMVSHDLHVVMAATDRVICLNAHVCCTGAPQAVTRDPEYLKLFGPHAHIHGHADADDVGDVDVDANVLGEAPAYALYAHHHDHHHEVDGSVIHDDPEQAAREDGHNAG